MAASASPSSGNYGSWLPLGL